MSGAFQSNAFQNNAFYVGVVVSDRNGGDDAFHHPLKHTGWNKKEWQRKHKREEALEQTILATYQKITGEEPAPIVVQEVVREAIAIQPQPERFDYSSVSEWLAMQEIIVARIIEKRRQDDEDESILLLMMA